jgi:hypothetical protein
MRFRWLLLGAFVACSSLAFAQTFEAAVGGGQSVFPGNTADIGTSTIDPASGTYVMKDGFRLVLRMALSQGRFFGHEFGYAFSRTSLDTPAVVTTAGTGLPGQSGIVTTIPAQNISLPSHQGFTISGLCHAGRKGVRPFAAGECSSLHFPSPAPSTPTIAKPSTASTTAAVSR